MHLLHTHCDIGWSRDTNKFGCCVIMSLASSAWAKFILTLSIPGSLLFVSPLTARADLSMNAFGTCRSEDGVHIGSKSYFYYENLGRDNPGRWIEGGSYVTSTEKINKQSYGGPPGYLTTTAYRLKRNDGVWVEKLYLPLKVANLVCN